MNALSRWFKFGRKSGEVVQVISTPRQLLEFLERGQLVSSGVTVNAQSAFDHMPVFACIKVLSESVGQLPLHLYRRKANLREKADDLPLYWALHAQPNEYLTSQEFWEMCVAHLCLRGNFFALINRGDPALSKIAPTIELLPMSPDAVTVRQREDRSIAYEVLFTGGKKAVLGQDEVLHIKSFSLDGVRGVSVLTHARSAIGRNIAVAEHASRFFRNSARPGGIISHPKVMSDTAYKRLKESWDEMHMGVDQAHRVAVLEEGSAWTSVGLSAEDAQMLESQKFGRTEICGLFRVPPSMIGDLERATFSNTEQQARSFIDFSLMPYLTRIEQRIRMQLIGEEDRKSIFAKFNTGALLRGDMVARADFYTKQVQNGALSPNEVRELEDLNPREGGDIWLTPSNMLVNGKLPEGMGKAPPAEPAKAVDVEGAIARALAPAMAKMQEQATATALELGRRMDEALEQLEPVDHAPSEVEFKRDSHGALIGASVVRRGDANH